MQKLFVFAALVLFSSCKKSNVADVPVNDPVNPNATIIAKGNFSGTPGHSVSGSVEIITENNQKKLVLRNFSSSGGPDLRVYLSTNLQASNFISLGMLRSTNGQQVYDINGMPDFAQYKFALIWCQQFSVLFGSAELK